MPCGDPVNILDKNFRYTNAASTDIARTFARVRKQLAEEAKRKAENEVEATKKVAKIARKQ